MKNNKIRYGVVGVGYLGNFHAQKITQLNNVDLIGVVDSDRNTVEKIANENNCLAFTKYQDLFDKVDVISIVTPTVLHYQIAKDFLQNGIHVLIEKPITTTSEEAVELIEIANKNKLKIQVGHLERYNPVILAIEKKNINPSFIRSERLSVYKTRATDINVALDLMIHDIEIIQYLLKSKIKTLDAFGSKVLSKSIDIVNVNLEFETGCIANLTASRISNYSQRISSIFEKDGYYVIDFQNRILTEFKKQSKDNNIIQSTQQAFGQSDPLLEEIKDFVNVIINDLEPKVTAKMGADALDLAIKIGDLVVEKSK